MFKYSALAAVAATALFAVPASAATVVFGPPSPGGVITLTPAGPGEVAGFLGFDVINDQTGPNFTATLTFVNPFSPAAAGGSAVFNFDGDLLVFTGGNISGGGVATVTTNAQGSSIQVDAFNLAAGPQTLTFTGTLNPTGNGTARVGGQLSLSAVPEPGTWALFILGFGGLGYAMRRRNAQVRTAKAKLHFA